MLRLAVRRMKRPNVLLIVLDSVRAKNTSLHGYGRETTLFLEEFAEQSTQHEQARAPPSWSLPSHVGMFTGLHVAEHNPQIDGQIRKDMLWKDETKSIVTDSVDFEDGTGTNLSSDNINEFPERFTDHDVSVDSDSGINENAQERFRDLGYI